MESCPQFIGRNVNPCVLHLDLMMLNRGVLYLRRKRMLNRITENAETNRRTNRAPISQVLERVNGFRARALLLHFAPNCAIARSNLFETRSLPITSTM